MRMNIILVVLVVIVVAVVAFLEVSETQSNGRIKLSVDQTLGAVFIGDSGPETPDSAGPTIIASANSKAKPELYALLQNKNVVNYHKNILLMFGYIGNEKDVNKLHRWLLDETLKGDVSQAEFDSAVAYFHALATMSRRGIEPARTLLGRMSTVEFWDNEKNIRLPQTINAFVTDRPIDALLLYALPAYATSGADDWNDKIKNYLAQVKDDSLKQYMAGQLDAKRMKSLIDEETHKRYPPISDDVLESLEHLFNGDLKNPGRSKLLGRSKGPI